MKLTEKDKEFLERLRRLMNERELYVDFQEEGLKRLILRRNYGERIAQEFEMTRQGVRWRFQRLFSDIYPSAYEVVLWIESNFGTELRAKAMEMARQRVDLRKKAMTRTSTLNMDGEPKWSARKSK